MNKIIIMYEDYDRESNMSLYDYIDCTYRHATPIMVCHVTEEEYSTMQKQLKSGCLNERLPRIASREEIGYNKFRYFITYDKQNNNLLVSDYNNTNKIGSYTIDSEGIHYDEKGYQFTNHPVASRMWRAERKVYTTETYEDVIKYYTLKQDKDYQIRQKEKELIELLGRNCKTCNTECCGGQREKGCERWSHIIRYKE